MARNAQFMDAAKAQTGAALALARARLLLASYIPPIPARDAAIAALGELVECLTPRNGEMPRLRFVQRPAPTPAKRNGHNHAGKE
jgi:hypothetical protein